MPSKLEILSQVMLSLKSDQNNAMNNINALLNKKDTKEGLIESLKAQIYELSKVHATMQETESFMVQITASLLGKEPGKESEDSNEDEKEEK